MHKVGKLPIWGKNWDRDLSEVVERKVPKKAKQKLLEALKREIVQKIAIIILGLTICRISLSVWSYRQSPEKGFLGYHVRKTLPSVE